MQEVLEAILSALGDLSSDFAGVTEPSLVVLLNIIILALAAVVALGRFRAELRQMDWNRKTPEERRQIIYNVLKEAYDTTEWLFSNLAAVKQEDKVRIGQQKKKTAVTYARRELTAMGAGGQDLATLNTRLEQVAADHKAPYVRYSQRMMPDRGVR